MRLAPPDREYGHLRTMGVAVSLCGDGWIIRRYVFSTVREQVRRPLPRSPGQVQAQLLVSELVDTAAGTIAHRSNVYSAIVPEAEDPLRPCSVDLVGSAVVYELSPHPLPPEPLLPSFTAGGESGW